MHARSLKLLITGVPGTGKTVVADYIAREHGFYHVDMERDGFRSRHEFSLDSASFLAGLAGRDVVVSWGFSPFTNRRSIEAFTDDGFALFWFDGDRVASFREFMRREGNDPVRECEYYGQMQMIVATEFVERVKPIIVNPFDENGDFRPAGKIAAEILGAV